VRQPDAPCALLDIHYRPNQNKPHMRDRLALKRTGEWLATQPKATVVIRSYTDAQGSAAKNLTLSHARAVWIREALATHGAQRKQMRAQAYGEYAPRMDVAPSNGANRRVVVEALDVVCPPSLQENAQ
jgi:outer membrane protein OmpA-like peptidoglycan-associated protein